MATRLNSKLHLLTVREILAAGDGDHTDGGGLLLRIRAVSSSWVFRYTAATGKRREMGLGVAHRASSSLASASVAVARDLARQAREQLAKGVDPIDSRAGERDARKQAEQRAKEVLQRQRMTLARAAREYHARVIDPSRTAKHSAQWLRSLENHIPAKVWNKPIDAVEAPELLKALESIKPHDRARNLTQGHRIEETLQRIRQRLDAIFEDAIFHGLCKTNPAAAIRRKIREGKARRDRGQFAALPYQEAPEFMVMLQESEGVASRCLEFAMLTAARTKEAIEATWDEFDLDAGVWTVPAERMKAREPHTVHLSARALAVLAKVQDFHPVLVFPSPVREDRPLSNMAMLTVLSRIGVRDRTTVHGLCRATFSTWANETGVARPDVIEACLAHEESNRVRAAYNRSEFMAERRALLSVWGEYLCSPPVSNVVPLKAA